MRVDLYALLRDSIEDGLQWGLRGAFKYDATPKTEDQMIDATDRIMDEIMNKVCEYLRFDDDERPL